MKFFLFTIHIIFILLFFVNNSFSDIFYYYDGRTFSGKLIAIKGTKVNFALEDGKKEEKSILDEISIIEVEKKIEKSKEKKDKEALVYFVNGDKLHCEIINYDGTLVNINTFFGEISILKSSIDCIEFSQEDIDIPLEVNQDSLLLKNGDILKGKIAGIKSNIVEISSSLGNFDIDINRIKKIKMGSFSRIPFMGKDLIFVVEFFNGDRISGRYLSYYHEKLIIEPIWTLKVKQPVVEFDRKNLRTITFRNTRIVYLSDLKPYKVKEVPYFDFHYPYKLDMNLFGKDLSICGMIYRKGISMQSFTELTYEINSEFEIFESDIGIDDSAEKDGEVNLEIFGDDKKLFSKNFNNKERVEKLRLNLKGVKYLRIVAGFGNNMDISSFITLGNPRLKRYNEFEQEIIKVNEGIYKIGRVTVDKNKKIVSFPAKLNMKEGLIEFLVCNKDGKLYESIFSTDVEPVHLQVALILLGLEYGQNIEFRNDPRIPKGAKLEILIEWDEGSKTVQKSAYEVIFDRVKNKNMEKGYFVFTGSRIINGVFLAQEESSLIATFHDPGSIINYSEPTLPDKTGYSAYDADSKNLPEINKEVNIIIKPVE
jgi:sRNA-binding regulator protein Hfq